MQFASDLDEETKVRIDSGRRYTELLKQDQHATMPFHLQVISIYGANNGLLDGAPTTNVRAIESKFLDLMEREMREVVTGIESGRAITDTHEVELKNAIASFRSTNVELYTA
jgi:F-type H+-transporting ATPase subunit alpha